MRETQAGCFGLGFFMGLFGFFRSLGVFLLFILMIPAIVGVSLLLIPLVQSIPGGIEPPPSRATTGKGGAYIEETECRTTMSGPVASRMNAQGGRAPVQIAYRREGSSTVCTASSPALKVELVINSTGVAPACAGGRATVGAFEVCDVPKGRAAFGRGVTVEATFPDPMPVPYTPEQTLILNELLIWGMNNTVQ